MAAFPESGKTGRCLLSATELYFVFFHMGSTHFLLRHSGALFEKLKSAEQLKAERENLGLKKENTEHLLTPAGNVAN